MTLEMKMQDIKSEGIEEGKLIGFYEGRQTGKLEGLSDGIKKGALQNAIATAKKLLSMGLSLEQIADITTLPVNQVRHLQQELDSAE